MTALRDGAPAKTQFLPIQYESRESSLGNQPALETKYFPQEDSEPDHLSGTACSLYRERTD